MGNPGPQRERHRGISLQTGHALTYLANTARFDCLIGSFKTGLSACGGDLGRASRRLAAGQIDAGSGRMRVTQCARMTRLGVPPRQPADAIGNSAAQSCCKPAVQPAKSACCVLTRETRGFVCQPVQRLPATIANIAPCGSTHWTTQLPPGTCIGPLTTFPPPPLTRAAAASTASTLK